MEAANKAPLTHHETQRQHEERADPCHDVGDGHQRGLVCLRDVVATVLQVDAVERALDRGCAKFIVHCERECRKDSFKENRDNVLYRNAKQVLFC